MNPKVSERSLEDAIEQVLLSSGAGTLTGEGEIGRETATYGEGAPGGYERRRPEDYDRALCLIPQDVLDFIYATQPKEWERLKQHYGAEVKERFLKRLPSEIERRGTLDVLRKGIKDSGCKFDLAYFRPSSGLNEELREKYQANQFSVGRQLRYSAKNENSLDLVLFLNGIPIFTAELKNPLTGQTVDGGRAGGLPGQAHRLRAPLHLPLPDPKLHGRRPRKASPACFDATCRLAARIFPARSSSMWTWSRTGSSGGTRGRSASSEGKLRSSL